MNSKVSRKVCQARETPDVDLFAFRVSQQLLQHISCIPNPFSIGQDIFQLKKIATKSSLKPSRALSDKDGEGERRFEESISRPRDNDNNTSMTRSVVVSTVALTLTKEFNPFPYMDNLLMDPSDNLHALIQEGLLKLLTWTVSGRTCIQREYQREPLSLFQTPADRVPLSITSRLGQNGVADILDGKYLTLDHN